MTTMFHVEKMRCSGCAKHVTEAVQAALPGAKIDIDLATGTVAVSPTPDQPASVIKAIAEAGYTAHVAHDGDVWDADFRARRQAARARLDAMNPHMTPEGDPSDPTGDRWFSKVYALANDDAANVPWAALEPNSLLMDWLAGQKTLSGKRALDVGCGLGDNAEALAAAGARVAAFDYIERAIDWAKRRYPNSLVDYRAADLLDPPHEWLGAFDIVHECYTLQTINEEMFMRAAHALASLVAPGGRLLVISAARDEGEPQTTPWRPLTRADIESLAVDGLVIEKLEDVPQEGYVSRRWRAIFSRENAPF
ncbi:methyltransferase domain-containing protein [Methylocystis sp. 9N]|uniref:Methyltransferase domain-containing protein n=1 Tax=Methylocystis borbori TaxID=3118750 RepID=A0ABU7XCK3_9HYPH